MGEQSNTFFAVPQQRHDMLVKPDRDETARQEFVRGFKAFIQSGIVPGIHASYHNEVKPAFERQTGRSPRDRHEIRDLMIKHPLFQTYASLQRVSQELLWDVVLDSVERELPALMATAVRRSAHSRLIPRLICPSTRWASTFIACRAATARMRGKGM